MSDTLEDFLGQYVRNKKLSSTAESYGNWLSAYGSDAKDTLDKQLSAIEDDYQRAKSTYGTKAERLAALGLSSSGYSDYLDGVAYAERERAKSNAYRTAANTEAQNRRGYENYLASYQKEQSGLLEKAYKAIADSGTFDEDAAYRRALGMGLDAASAKEAVAGGIALSKEKIRRALYREILSEGLGRDGAVAYAKTYGFSDAEAGAFGDYAEAMNGTKKTASSDGTEKIPVGGSYTDYLRRRLDARSEKK